MLARRHWLPQRSRSANFFGQQTSFFSGRAPPSLRRSSFSALPVLSSVSTQGHTTLSTVVALRTLIGASKICPTFGVHFSEDLDAATAGYRVGYNDASHSNR